VGHPPFANIRNQDGEPQIWATRPTLPIAPALEHDVAEAVKTDGTHDAVLAGVLVVLTLIVKFPSQYRRGMARLCSVEEERIPPYPRVAAIALFGFFGFILVWDLFRYLSGR